MDETEGPREIGDSTLDEMLMAARAILPRAYVPYSGFHVGAALLNEDGTIRPGVNIENASYPLSVCAERNAVAAMVASGQQKILAVAVATDAPVPTPPCGGCRQVLWEFGDADTPVVAEGADGVRTRWRLGELLPHAFGPDDLR
ncbi:MAG TPA: cytidine deaminase [Actinomycetota bacterium]|nr:cytidine deaminase [Actinomycetota bacterium]